METLTFFLFFSRVARLESVTHGVQIMFLLVLSALSAWLWIVWSFTTPVFKHQICNYGFLFEITHAWLWFFWRRFPKKKSPKTTRTWRGREQIFCIFAVVWRAFSQCCNPSSDRFLHVHVFWGGFLLWVGANSAMHIMNSPNSQHLAHRGH